MNTHKDLYYLPWFLDKNLLKHTLALVQKIYVLKGQKHSRNQNHRTQLNQKNSIDTGSYYPILVGLRIS